MVFLQADLPRCHYEPVRCSGIEGDSEEDSQVSQLRMVLQYVLILHSEGDASYSVEEERVSSDTKGPKRAWDAFFLSP